MRNRWWAGLLAGSAVLAIALGASQSAAQIKQGKTRPLTTKQMMAGLVGPHYGGLNKELETDPADDKAWEALATKAALLNESAYMMMEDGRCPDATWAGACKEMQQKTSAVLDKIKSRDREGAKSLMASVGASCKSCHVVFKK